MNTEEYTAYLYSKRPNPDKPKPGDMTAEEYAGHVQRLKAEIMAKQELELNSRRIAETIEHRKTHLIESIFPDEGPLRRELYPKHMEFFRAGKEHREVLFLSGNRTGKSVAGGFRMACDLTGIYPPWWEGKKNTKTGVYWAAGDTAKTTRDIIQNKLLGPAGSFGTGLIPKHLLVKTLAKVGIPEAIEIIYVKHISGKNNICILKSYDQRREAFQGTEVMDIWLDEESPQDIYTECLLRTMTTQGSIYTTFTPLMGLSDVVLSFCPNGEVIEGELKDMPSKYLVACDWSQVPHLSQKDKDELLASIPPYQRDARSKGIPQLGSGAIYQVPETEIVVDDFNIPDYWRRVYGMDVGWNRCLAKDSMVMLPDGSEKPIQDLHIGEEVLAFDFTTETLVPTKIIDTFVGFANNMVTVGISDYQTITCTDDHPFAHRAASKDPIAFKKVRDINKRIREFQSVVLPSKWIPEKQNDVCSLEMARVVGYLLGDGCLTYTNRRIEFAQKTPELIDDFRRCVESVGCRMSSYANNSTHHLSGIVHGENAILNFIRECGLLGADSSTKFIPPAFFMATEDIIKNLLAGLIHTDGSIEGDNARYYTVSKNLADGVKKLCLRLGIYASISIDKRKRKITHNDVYRVTLRRPSCLPLLPPKQLKPIRPERKKRHDRLLSKYKPAKPQSIYCITVEHPDHAFVCNGFVVSNTAAIWGAINPDTGIVYLYSEHYVGRQEPIIHAAAIKSRGDWIPGVIDPAARGRSQTDGHALFDSYLELGLHITAADNSREAGIYKVWDMLLSGKLKIFKSLSNFRSEYRIYRRDEKGNIVKSNDHLMDAVRYLCQSGLDIAKCKPPEKIIKHPGNMSTTQGWMS